MGKLITNWLISSPTRFHILNAWIKHPSFSEDEQLFEKAFAQ